jgi:inorganic phosphate transporter, PiT family
LYPYRDTKGMSVSLSIEGLPTFRKPIGFGGTGKNPLWQIDDSIITGDIQAIQDSPNAMTLNLVCLVVLAFYMAFMMGANDVANSMGTSVGSKALTLGKAIAIAGVMEFAGAVIFGQNVSNTIATGIVRAEVFQTNPQSLILGMISVLLACSLWLNFANWRRLPVASSHAIIGALVGFGWYAQGVSVVNWLQVGSITCAWIVAPLFSATLAYVFLRLIQTWILPANIQEWIPWLSVSVLGAIALTVISGIDIQVPNYLPVGAVAIASLGLTMWLWRVERSVESVFGQLQILSASFVAFAHGSNDVGHAIAPLAVAVELATTGTLPQSNQLAIPIWILVLGGVGIVAGLSILGSRVMATIGTDITLIETKSGFAAELATAITILIASNLGMPASTTHALVGAVIGVGLVHGRDAVNFKLLQTVALAWLVTIPIAALLAASLFAGGSLVGFG